MEIMATIVFGVSVLGLALLFFIKHWEEKNARIFVPAARLAADGYALEFKAFLMWCEDESRKLGPTSVRIARALLHDLALSLAALSRASERGAHRLADMVSHKHHFERRETKSEFLKQVGEFPIRNFRESVPPPPPPLSPAGGQAPPQQSPHSAAYNEKLPQPVISETLQSVKNKPGRSGKGGKHTK